MGHQFTSDHFMMDITFESKSKILSGQKKRQPDF